MTKLIAGWLWRIAVVVLLAWIGAELHALHDDLMAPEDDQPATTATPARWSGTAAAVSHELTDERPDHVMHDIKVMLKDLGERDALRSEEV
jgi:hypothetical protein